MNPNSDSPRVFIPPPLIYASFLIAGILLHKAFSIDGLFYSTIVKGAGIILLICSLFFLGRSLRQFFATKNTLITFKPATSLQTGGIYTVTRNPMYLGLAIVYLGLTLLIGNLWNLILFPLLIIIVQEYIIKREERYLERAFGLEYTEYKQKVRRWI